MKSEDAEKLINEIRRMEENGTFTPNEWEDEFMTSIQWHIGEGKKIFSDKQQACLEKIYQKATEGECYR